MIAEWPEIIVFRTSTTDLKKMQELVKEGKAKSVSQLIRNALEEYLSK